jgi:hypothetical protein
MAVNCDLLELQPILSKTFNKKIKLRKIELVISGYTINAAYTKTFKESLNIIDNWTDKDYQVFEEVSNIIKPGKITSKYLKGITNLSKKLKDMEFIEIYETISESEINELWDFLTSINGMIEYKNQIFELKTLGPNYFQVKVPFQTINCGGMRTDTNFFGPSYQQQRYNWTQKYLRAMIAILRIQGKEKEFKQKLLRKKLEMV